MTKEEWWKAAVKVGGLLRENLNNPVGLPIAKQYMAVRKVLFPNDNHHPPSDEKGSTLQQNLQGWTRDVERGVYDNRFST